MWDTLFAKIAWYCNFKNNFGKIQQSPLNTYDKESTQVNSIYLYQEPVGLYER